MSAYDWKTLPGLILDGDEPVFEEPWQAQAFAMTVAMNERGLFEWPQWAEHLGKQISIDPNTPYWVHWMKALEDLMEKLGIADTQAINQRTQQWHDAAARTPHGEPINLVRNQS